MDRVARERLFHELRKLSAPTQDKPLLSENLTDVLEILAVTEGIKPAHLNGHGFRSAQLNGHLESLAARYGLSTLRTTRISRFQYRPPTCWPEVAQWQREQDEARRVKEGDVIWIYRDPGIAQLIPDTVAGRISCSRALGYPECCVNADFERSEYMFAALVNGLHKKFNVDTAEEMIALLIRDEGVSIDIDPIRKDMELSSARFPYVQFFACAACLAAEESPAARVNRAMRDLAFAVSPSFGVSIWRAALGKSEPRRKLSVPRNDSCPCCSGRKFKKCCGLIQE